MAENPLTVRGRNQKHSNQHQVSDHKPAMEDTNKTVTGEVETEMHFLLRCKLFSDVRTTYFNQFRSVFQ